MTKRFKRGFWLWFKTIFFTVGGISMIAISNLKSDPHPSIDYGMGLFMMFVAGACTVDLWSFYRD